jgi:hypothetical protein
MMPVHFIAQKEDLFMAAAHAVLKAELTKRLSFKVRPDEVSERERTRASNWWQLSRSSMFANTIGFDLHVWIWGCENKIPPRIKNSHGVS